MSKSSASARDRRLAFALVALIAAIPRLVYLLQIWHGSPTFMAPEGGDSIFYDRVASTSFEPDRAYFHSPLYQWFLSGIYAVVGRNLVIVRVIQHVLGVLTALAVTDVGHRLLRRWRPAVVGGVVYALAGPPTFYEGHLLVDALVPVLVVGTVWLALRDREAPTITGAVAVGAAVGLATLARGTFLLWLPVLAWSMWRQPPRKLVRPAALALGATLTIAPVTVRNYVVERDLVLTAANAGINLYIGNNKRAHGAYVLPSGVWFRAGDPNDDFRGLGVATQALGHSPKSSELSRWWSRKAIDYALGHPGRTLDVTLAKARLTLSDYEFPQLYHYYGYAAVAPVLAWLPTAGWLLAPGLFALALVRRRVRWDPRMRTYLWLLLVQAAAFLPFFVVGRYRVGLLPLLAPFVGLALVDGRRWWRHASARGRVILAAWAALCALVVFLPPPTSFRAAPQYDAFGDAAARAGDRPAARRWYARALEDTADYEPSLHALVAILLDEGDIETAHHYVEAAIEEGAKSSRTYEYLGRIAHADGRLDAAREALRKAIDAEPGNVKAWRAYARVLVDAGDPARARAALESAAALEKDPARAQALRDEARRLGG